MMTLVKYCRPHIVHDDSLYCRFLYKKQKRRRNKMCLQDATKRERRASQCGAEELVTGAPGAARAQCSGGAGRGPDDTWLLAALGSSQQQLERPITAHGTRPWRSKPVGLDSFTPIYTNITDAHESLPHWGQTLPFSSSEICFLRTDSDILAHVIVLFVVVFISATVWFLRPAAAALIHSCREGKKRYLTFFSGAVFSVFGADKDSSALSRRRSLIFTFEEMNQALVGPHLRWNVLYSRQVSCRWNEQRRIFKLKSSLY